MNDRPIIVPASAAHLAQIGEHPKGAGRAYAAIAHGEVLGVCGYYHDRDRLVLYSKVRPELRRWKKTLVRGAKMALAAAMRVRSPIVASADPAIPGARRMLEALGFDLVEGNLYWRDPWAQQR